MTALLTPIRDDETKDNRGDNWLRGDYMHTFSGLKFYPGDPRPSEIRIKDIAHHLSNICRFTGATKRFYSVAQHSVMISLSVPPEDALYGLLHDAAEAYVNDLNRPVKHRPELVPYRDLEKNIFKVIRAKFRLADEEPASVKMADVWAVAAELRDLVNGPKPNIIRGLPAPFDQPIVAWPAYQAKKAFLDRFFELTKKAEATMPLAVAA